MENFMTTFPDLLRFFNQCCFKWVGCCCCCCCYRPPPCPFSIPFSSSGFQLSFVAAQPKYWLRLKSVGFSEAWKSCHGWTGQWVHSTFSNARNQPKKKRNIVSMLVLWRYFDFESGEFGSVLVALNISLNKKKFNKCFMAYYIFHIFFLQTRPTHRTQFAAFSRANWTLPSMASWMTSNLPWKIQGWGAPIELILMPTGSMYGIFTYIWLTSMVHVSKYTIYGSYRIAFIGKKSTISREGNGSPEICIHVMKW